MIRLILFLKNKILFEYVGLATNFLSSLASCRWAMVARSRHKNLCCLLVKFMILFSRNGIATLFLLLSATLFAEIGYVEPWGKDTEIVSRHSLEPFPELKKPGLLSRMAFQAILFRQKVLSPADGPRSHFRPSSSQYMFQAIRENGFLKGYIMGCDRLMRENKEEWVYKSTTYLNKTYKWDPTSSPAKRRSSSKKAGG